MDEELIAGENIPEGKSHSSVEHDSDTSRPTVGNKPAKPKSADRVYRRKTKFKKKKRRGEYKAKPKTEPAPSNVGFTDIVECFFSDDEVRAEYLEEHSSAVDYICDAQQDEESLEPFSPVENLCYSNPSSSSEMSSEARSDQSSAYSEDSSSILSTHGSRPSSSQSISPQREMSTEMDISQGHVQSPFDLASQSEVMEEQYQNIEIPESRPESSLSSHSDAISGLKILDDAFCDLPSDELVTPCFPTIDLIEAGLNRLRKSLFHPWVPVTDQYGYHLLFLSHNCPKAIQRDVFISYQGKVTITVHCVELVKEKQFLRAPIPQLTSEEVIDKFCESSLWVVKLIMQFDICVGANHEETKSVWNQVSNAYIDQNPYQERNYVATCRSSMCLRLVELGKRTRCVQCSKIMKSLFQRKESLLSESPDRRTNNMFLTPTQAMLKIKHQSNELEKNRKELFYLKKKIQKIIETEGVELDNTYHKDLSNLLSKCSNISAAQKMFLEEQLSCASKKDSRAHRWHPSMIRLALHLKMTSSSAYDALRDSGAVLLPSSRTLFDYSKGILPEVGISDGLISLVYDRVSKLEHGYQRFHSLLCDEMHISQNLVYRKSDGKLMGYVYLENFEKEWQRFDNLVSGKDTSENRNVLASSILAYMVKGVASDVKCVIAAFPCKNLNQDMLYHRTWQVISRLELAGINILTFVCDGNAVNRAFINLHTPISKTDSGVVFDTLNFCSEDERPLFFISDVCHLLKTARNAFYNSGPSDKKPRCMQYNGENIFWNSVIRLYLTYRGDNLRHSYKLNAQNVFPNSFSQMKVSYAAQVLSNTVATDMEAQNWPNHKEVVNFIKNFNKFFDCLNGAFSKQGTRTKNLDLAPYTSVDDPRFDWLRSFLDYLSDWKKQAAQLPLPSQEQAKTMLPRQTLDGIEMAIKGFTGATKYLLNQGMKFVMARVFSQDPLEQHFSLQRSGGGGSRNPNASQFLSKQVSLAVQRNLGVRKRKSNVRDESPKGMEITDEPLVKRQRRAPKRYE